MRPPITPPDPADQTHHTELADLTDDALVQELVTWAGRVAAGEARLLALVGELDRREAWAQPGLLSCAHWLSWRLGLGLVAARERVRVARALRDLPLTAAALAGGRLSYSQVRALTRIATPGTEADLVSVAEHATGAQLERIARGVGRVHAAHEAERGPEHHRWRMRARVRHHEDGTVALSLHLPAEQAAVVLAALDQVRAELDALAADGPRAKAADHPGSEASDGHPLDRGGRGPDGRDTGAAGESPGASAEAPAAGPRERATLGQAVLELATRQLAAAPPGPAARRARAALTVQVDPLTGWARLRDDELLPPSAAAPLLARGAAPFRLRPLVDGDLRRHDAGRDSREAPPALRELLGTVDGERCRFPGCVRRRRLHSHHVQEWQDGGRTDLANLVLLCARHHQLVHRQGFRLALRSDRGLEVRTADDVRVLHHPAAPAGVANELPTGPPDRTVPGDRLELSYAVMVLTQQAA